MCVSLQSTATGAHGSRGASAQLPAAAARGLASVSVIIRLRTVGDVLAQETPLSCRAVTLRPVQVGLLSHARFSFCFTPSSLKMCFPRFTRRAAVGQRKHHREHQ